jgi:hypothetical protein
VESLVDDLAVVAGCGKGNMLGVELPWRQIGECRVWAHAVVIGLPRGQHSTGLGERGEECLVQALIAQPTNEAFDDGVLQRLTRRDKDGNLSED